MDKRNSKIIKIIIFIIITMICLVIASVPLYNLFCKVTGFGGFTRKVISPSNTLGERFVRVYFNADVSKNTPLIFKSEQDFLDVKIGENILAFYSVENNTTKDFSGIAIYNVVPHRAAKYFNKVYCFCFEQQTFYAGEKISFPVYFFIDAAIEKDYSLSKTDSLTLSYMFFPYNK